MIWKDLSQIHGAICDSKAQTYVKVLIIYIYIYIYIYEQSY